MNILRHSLIVLCAVTICACERQGYNDDRSINVPDQPTEDALAVRTQSRAYIFPHSYTGSAKALVDRVADKSTVLDASVMTVLVHDKTSSSLTEAETDAIAALLARGGSLVLSEPTGKGVDAILRKVQASIRKAIGEGPLSVSDEGRRFLHNILNTGESHDGLLTPVFIDEGDTDGVICDVLAVRGGEYHIITDLDDVAPIRITLTGDDDSSGESYTETLAEGMPTAYMYGLHADALATWLDAGGTMSASRSLGILASAIPEADYQDLDKITNAQKISYSYSAYAGHKFEPVTISYEIWAANDTKGTDYYLVHQELRAENTKLVCGPTSAQNWNKYRVNEAFGDVAKDPRAYWAYMTRFGTQTEFSDKGAALEHISPANSIKGETTYTENLTWSIDGAFVISTSPGIQLGGGVQMSKTWTHNVMDLEMDFTYNGNKPKWEYNAGIFPKLTKDAKNDWRHDFARSILRSDCTMGHSWIWSVGNASGVYSFTSKTWIGIQGLYIDIKKNLQRGSKYKTFSTEDSKTLRLNPPARYEQEWLMVISPYSENTERVMKTYFPNYWFPSFSLYTVQQNDRDAIDTQIAATTAVLTENAKLLEDNNVESFTLSWKLLHEQTVYKTWSYTAPQKE